MSNEIKMSDVFTDECIAYSSYLVDNYTDPDNLTVIANFDMDYVQVVSEKMTTYAAHAINQHDKLTARVTELEDKNIALLQCLFEIQSECIGELAMGYKLDAQSIGESITQTTKLAHPELLELLERN